MSELPWYERRPVLGGTIAAVALLLAAPFVDNTWPSKASAALGSPWARGVLQVMTLGGAYLVGFVVGRRRRPYSGPLMVVDGAATETAPPVKGPPQLTIVEASSGVKVHDHDLIAAFTWVITPKERAYIPVRADLLVGGKQYRAERVRILPGGQHPQASAIPAETHGHVEVQFHVPDDVARPGMHLSGDVTLTDSSNEIVTRPVDFGPVPKRLLPAPWNWP